MKLKSEPPAGNYSLQRDIAQSDLHP